MPEKNGLFPVLVISFNQFQFLDFPELDNCAQYPDHHHRYTRLESAGILFSSFSVLDWNSRVLRL